LGIQRRDVIREFLTVWTNVNTAIEAVKGILRVCRPGLAHQPSAMRWARVGKGRSAGARTMDKPTKPRRTRIQREKRELILEAALEVFSQHGSRGSTIDQIAEAAGMSKPNLLYYFKSKEAIFVTLIDRLMEAWLAPLREMDADGDPVREIR